MARSMLALGTPGGLGLLDARCAAGSCRPDRHRRGPAAMISRPRRVEHSARVWQSDHRLGAFDLGPFAVAGHAAYPAASSTSLRLQAAARDGARHARQSCPAGVVITTGRVQGASHAGPAAGRPQRQPAEFVHRSSRCWARWARAPTGCAAAAAAVPQHRVQGLPPHRLARSKPQGPVRRRLARAPPLPRAAPRSRAKARMQVPAEQRTSSSSCPVAWVVGQQGQAGEPSTARAAQARGPHRGGPAV
jgi:hypothetical protein